MKIEILGRTIEIKSRTSTLPAPSNDEAWGSYLMGGGDAVTSINALKISTVLRCVDVVAKTMASLPLVLYRRTKEGSEKAVDHRLYRILHRQANKYTTAYEFWHMYIVNLMLTRGAFAKIERDRRGFITALWNIPTRNASNIYTNSKNGERYIYVTDGDEMETLHDGEFMYTPSLRYTTDNKPTDPIVMAADVIGLTIGLNKYARTAFEAGANPGGFIEHPSQLSDTAYERFKNDFERNYAGAQNQHRWMYLEEGAKASPFTRDLEKSQALESRKFAVTEICRVFGVPPHKVFDLERATFSNIEQQNIEYVQESIDPMSVRLEQTIEKDLLTESEQNTLYPKFNTKALMRGDITARTNYYHNARQDGWMNANDIRELEDMNLISAEDGGEVYAVNGNLIPLSSVPQNLPKGAAK